MSVVISLHASEYGNLLRKLKQDRDIPICDSGVGFRIQFLLGINGDEKRPFSNKEISKLIKYYKYFEKFFTEQGLLPVKTLKNQEMTIGQIRYLRRLVGCHKYGKREYCSFCEKNSKNTEYYLCFLYQGENESKSVYICGDCYNKRYTPVYALEQLSK